MNNDFGSIPNLTFSEEEIEYARKERKILSMDLELSRICNLRCVYCYASSGKALKNELTLDQIKDVIDQGIRNGLKQVSIIGGGEPLMYPDFFKVTEYIKERGLGQLIVTNGMLITEEVAKKLKEHQVSVIMKLNSFNKETQDFLAGGKNVLDKIMAGYNNLLKVGYLKDDDVTLSIESIICKQNYEELPQIWRWARERGITPYFEMLTMQGRAQKYDLFVPVEKIKKLFNKFLEIDKEYGFDWTPTPPIAGLACKRHLYGILITSKGVVQACSGIDISLGNIQQESLKSILTNSEVLTNLRNIPESLKGPCKDCKENTECYGCRGSAYHLTGDYLDSDPLCWNNDYKILNKELA